MVRSGTIISQSALGLQASRPHYSTTAHYHKTYKASWPGRTHTVRPFLQERVTKLQDGNYDRMTERCISVHSEQQDAAKCMRAASAAEAVDILRAAMRDEGAGMVLIIEVSLSSDLLMSKHALIGCFGKGSFRTVSADVEETVRQQACGQTPMCTDTHHRTPNTSHSVPCSHACPCVHAQNIVHVFANMHPRMHAVAEGVPRACDCSWRHNYRFTGEPEPTAPNL